MSKLQRGMRVAINGFGRIGKCLLRAIFEQNLQEKICITKINSSCADISMEAHLLKYDSAHGIFKSEVTYLDDYLVVDGKKIKFQSSKKPEDISWDNVDILFECTGAFLTEEKNQIHLKNGAKKVLISAPPKDSTVKTILIKVNDEQLTVDDLIVSIGSCTTNCLAPFAKIAQEQIGIDKGYATTVHAYTNDQNIVDGYHKSDFRRARAAAYSIIPTSSGVSKAIAAVIPSLKGKLDGSAVRVPILNVSLIDFTFLASRNITKEEVNELIKQAANSNLKGILRYNQTPLVSIDFNHSTESCIFDEHETKVTDGNFVRVCLWYDNEWSFVIRMLEMSEKMHNL